jgi:hypothetical protein
VQHLADPPLSRARVPVELSHFGPGAPAFPSEVVELARAHVVPTRSKRHIVVGIYSEAPGASRSMGRILHWAPRRVYLPLRKAAGA